MHDLIITVACALATYRLAHLLASEDGPLDLLKRIRERLENTWWRGGNFLGDLIGCLYCNSVWIGYGLGFVWASYLELSPVWSWAALGGLAFSAVAMWLDMKIP